MDKKDLISALKLKVKELNELIDKANDLKGLDGISRGGTGVLTHSILKIKIEQGWHPATNSVGLPLNAPVQLTIIEEIKH